MSHLVASALLQMGPEAEVPVRASLSSVVGGAVGAFLTTLVVGVLMVAVAPDYTRARMADVVDRPLGNVGYGLVALSCSSSW